MKQNWESFLSKNKPRFPIQLILFFSNTTLKKIELFKKILIYHQSCSCTIAYTGKYKYFFYKFSIISIKLTSKKFSECKFAAL